MNGAAEALLSQFESAARTAQEAETAFRKTVAAQIARLEHEREIAFYACLPGRPRASRRKTRRLALSGSPCERNLAGLPGARHTKRSSKK
jgi:hypothetical protein